MAVLRAGELPVWAARRPVQPGLGRVQHSYVSCERLFAIKTFISSDFTYGYLVMQLCFGGTVIVM